eukprot:g43933.t1
MSRRILISPQRSSNKAIMNPQLKGTSVINLRQNFDAPSDEQFEANLEAMSVPTQLLKFGRNGKGFRTFMLTPSLDGIMWHSKNKAATKSMVKFSSVKEIVFSQRTEKFRLGKRKDLEQRSFSIIYSEAGGEETLDLVCKDEEEFLIWTYTLDALVNNKIPSEVLERVMKKLADGSPPSEGSAPHDGRNFHHAFQGANDIFAFGWGEWGQNGFGTARNSAAPALLEGLLGKGAMQVACGWAHTAVLLESGEVMVYGMSLGTGLKDMVCSPTSAMIPEKAIVSVHCGAWHTLALTEKGSVFAWGCNHLGQLGTGDTQDRTTPTVLPYLNDIESLAAGSAHSLALSVKGDLFACGDNSRGQLGLGADAEQCVPAPTQVKHLFGQEIVSIACGDFHSIACAKSETFSWGWNGCGQLGVGSMEDQHTPTSVEVLRGYQVTSVDCGAAHSVAAVFVPKFNTYFVYGWGSNVNGQLGSGKKKFLTRPEAIRELNKDIVVDEVACGAMHTLLRTDEGELLSAGGNRFGQLGHSNTADHHAFKSIGALQARVCRQVACGGEHTAVLTARTWVEDKDAKECMNCKVVFTFVVRKHHCRNCGGIFCSSCSNKKMAILKYGLTDPVRVCQNCYSKLGGR